MAGLTPAQVDFIENIVKEQLRYENIMEEQSEVQCLEQTWWSSKQPRHEFSSGQRWQPARDDIDKYLGYCNSLCQMTPQNFDELGISQSS